MTVFACAAVLFDCDGVLVDSDAVVEAAWTRWAAELGLDPDAVLPAVHGRRTADTVGAFVPAARRHAALERINVIELELATGTRPIAGAAALLAAEPTVRWAVVTSGNAPLARRRLQAAGLPVPATLVTGDDVEHGKPSADPYLLAAQQLGIRPDKAVVVEDSPTGVSAARAAGVSVVIGVGSRGLSNIDALIPDLRPLRWAPGGLRVEYQPASL